MYEGMVFVSYHPDLWAGGRNIFSGRVVSKWENRYTFRDVGRGQRCDKLVSRCVWRAGCT